MWNRVQRPPSLTITRSWRDCCYKHVAESYTVLYCGTASLGRGRRTTNTSRPGLEGGGGRYCSSAPRNSPAGGCWAHWGGGEGGGEQCGRYTTLPPLTHLRMGEGRLRDRHTSALQLIWRAHMYTHPPPSLSV
jgi:hypothetical protein